MPEKSSRVGAADPAMQSEGPIMLAFGAQGNHPGFSLIWRPKARS
jgi:hypothetical protein